MGSVPGVSRVRLVGAVLGLAVLLAGGCAESAQGIGPAPVETPASAAPTAPASPSPAGYPLGQPAQADNGQVEATVFEYRQPAAPGGPSGAQWAAIDAQVCVHQAAIFDVTVSQLPWLLISADGQAISPARSEDARFPQPAYPTDHRRLHPKDCARGWIVFAVPAGTRPVAVRYAPSGAPPVNWAVR